MRFINRNEFAKNAQELIDILFKDSGWDEVQFVDISGNDLLVICERQFKYHAYIDDFELRAFKKDIRTSMIYTKRKDNTVNLLKFMTKIFGKEYVDAYETYLSSRYASIQESIKDAEKKRDNELQEVLKAIDDISFRHLYTPEFEKSRTIMREGAKMQYISTKTAFLNSMREEFEKQKIDGDENLEMLKRLLS